MVVLSELAIYDVEVELLTPALLVERVGKRGYTSIRDRIPGQSIRGALLTVLWRLGVEQDRLSSLMVSADTALPCGMEERGEFGHPLTAIPKIPVGKDGKDKERYAISFLGPTWLEEFSKVCEGQLDLPTMMRKAFDEHARKIPGIGEKAHVFSLPLLEKGLGKAFKEAGKPGLFVRASYSTYLEISTAISHVRGASEAGMIYAYEALPAGSKFRTTLTDLDGALTDAMEERGLLKGGRADISIRLGRGASRGFGHAILRAVRVGERKVKEAISRAEKALEAGSVPLIATSPISRLEVSARGLLTVPSPPDVIEVPNLWHKNVALDISGGLRLRLAGAAGSEKRIKSYSLKAGLPRPELRGLVEGSLCLYKVEEARGDAAELLALLELAGLDELANICLNRVKVAVEDPFPDIKGLLELLGR